MRKTLRFFDGEWHVFDEEGQELGAFCHSSIEESLFLNTDTIYEIGVIFSTKSLRAAVHGALESKIQMPNHRAPEEARSTSSFSFADVPVNSQLKGEKESTAVGVVSTRTQAVLSNAVVWDFAARKIRVLHPQGTKEIDVSFDSGFLDEIGKCRGQKCEECDCIVHLELWPPEIGFLIDKWSEALMNRQDFLQVEANRACSGWKLRTVEARHNIGHWGELAHTLRHWLRGGRIVWEQGEMEQQKSFKLKTNLGQVLEALGPADPCESAASSSMDLGEDIKVGEDVRRKVKHTDLQHFQVSFSFERFVEDLCKESALPRVISRTPGYDIIRTEVEGRLKHENFSALMWVRNVLTNRDIEPFEFEGCEKAALALARPAGEAKRKVLYLGDEGKKIGLDVNCYISLFGGHERPLSSKGNIQQVSKTGRGASSRSSESFKQAPASQGDSEKRTPLQQLQFFTAVVAVSAAKVVVGERTGLIDLLSLCGGIPCCQFIGNNVHASNGRLDQVYAVGCGLGRSVDLADRKIDKPTKVPVGCSDPAHRDEKPRPCQDVDAVKVKIHDEAVGAINEAVRLRGALDVWNSLRMDESGRVTMVVPGLKAGSPQKRLTNS